MCGMASASRTISTGPESPVDVNRAARLRQRAPGVEDTRRRRPLLRGRRGMPTAISSLLLKTSLDRLYAEFNYPDSATDPIHIVRRFERPDDREIVGFCAAALAFGRVASVLQSIERLLAVVGPRPAAYVRAFEARQARDFSGLGHRWIRSNDLVGLIAILRADARSSRVRSNAFSPRATRRVRLTSARRSTAFRGARSSHGDLHSQAARIAGRLLLLSAALGRIRLQAVESVSALDGPPRRARSRRLDERPAVSAGRAARHARHPGRPLSRPDPLHQPRLGDGARNHRRAAGPRRPGSGEVRLRALSSRHDERVRVQPRAEGFAVSVTWGVPAARA